MVISYVEFLDNLARNEIKKFNVWAFGLTLAASTVITMLMLASDVVW